MTQEKVNDYFGSHGFIYGISRELFSWGFEHVPHYFTNLEEAIRWEKADRNHTLCSEAYVKRLAGSTAAANTRMGMQPLF